MKNLFNAHGVAIESAIIFMVVIFALCSLITIATISMRSLDKTMIQKSNDLYSMDQIGELFVESFDSSNKTISAQDSGNTFSGELRQDGWIRYSYDSPYGVHVDSDGKFHTLRIADWKAVESTNGNPTVRLIVTVAVSDENIYVLNWSDQENSYNWSEGLPTNNSQSAKDLSEIKDAEFVKDWDKISRDTQTKALQMMKMMKEFYEKFFQTIWKKR